MITHDSPLSSSFTIKFLSCLSPIIADHSSFLRFGEVIFLFLHVSQKDSLSGSRYMNLNLCLYVAEDWNFFEFLTKLG